MKLAIVGATGMVGRVLLDVVAEQGLPVTELIAAASRRSAGSFVRFRGQEVEVRSVDDALAARPDVAIFSAGGDVSRTWAPRYAEAGCTVIDNSSAWRMDPNVPLVVPEINMDTVRADHRLIANPNCSTIQMVLALSGLHAAYRLRRIVVATYQSVSGTGLKAVRQLEDERADRSGEMAYAHPIDMNCLPVNGDLDETGATSEEVKLARETQRIFDDRSIAVTATVVRVPVRGGHSEAVNAEFHRDFDLDEVRGILQRTPGVVIQDDPAHHIYPMPRDAEGRDEVFVGRIRRDLSQPNTLNLWVVADNLRKGAATNAVQIVRNLPL